MKVLVLNQYAGNKGDRAVAYFVMRALAQAGVDRITLSTHDRNFWKDDDAITRFKVHLVPWGWNVEGFNPRRRIDWERQRFMRHFGFPWLRNRLLLKKDLGISRWICSREYQRAVEEADGIIGTGGHILTTRFAEDCIVEMVYDLMVVAVMQKSFVLWSQTIGPFQFKDIRNKEAVERLLTLARSVFVRDKNSFAACRSMGLPENQIRYTFESVIGLNDEIRAYVPPSHRENVLGITVYNAEKRTTDEYNQYVESMAHVADYAVSLNMRVRFFPHEIRGAVIDDRQCIRDIIDRMKRSNCAEIFDEDVTTVRHLSEVASCRAFIGHKTHSVIFALTVGTPLVAISYHPKTVDFMSQYDLPGNCLHDQDLSDQNLIKHLDVVLCNADEIGKKQWERSCYLGNKVRDDFSEMLHFFS
jgi:polysaccharide pyruvyl transferase WcaK-like protein